MGNNVTTFDKNGFKTEYIVYSIDNFVEYHKAFKYNNRRLVKEEKESGSWSFISHEWRGKPLCVLR